MTDLKIEADRSAEAEVLEFLAALAPVDPTPVAPETTGDARRDPAIIIALASLATTMIFGIHTAYLTSLQIREHHDRRRLKKTLETLKAKLAETNGAARMDLPSGGSLDLTRTSTDDAIDTLINEFGSD